MSFKVAPLLRNHWHGLTEIATELILAYYMAKKHPRDLSIVGSDYPKNRYPNPNEEGFFDIELGADQFKETKKGSVYWDFQSGALGQYYAGALIAVGIIETTGGVFLCTEKGMELANSFDENLNKEERVEFLNIIKEGKLYQENFENLHSFSINKNVEGTNEWGYYWNMLTASDGLNQRNAEGIVPRQRVESIELLLSYLAKETGSWDEFPLAIYQGFSKLDQNKSQANWGWYLYQQNELIHFGLETIFWAMLESIHGKTKSLDVFIQSFSKGIYNHWNKHLNGGFENTQQLFDSHIIHQISVIDCVSGIKTAVKSGNIDEAGVFAFELLMNVFKRNQSQFPELEIYAQKYFVHDKNGYVISLFNTWFEPYLELSLERFINKIVTRILNDHTVVAYNKMGNGEASRLKFLIEDNYISHVETVEPRFTSPRLKSLYYFMLDLKLVGKDQKLSELGREKMNELKVVL